MCLFSIRFVELGREISEQAYWGGRVLRTHPRVRTYQGSAKPEIRHKALVYSDKSYSMQYIGHYTSMQYIIMHLCYVRRDREGLLESLYIA